MYKVFPLVNTFSIRTAFRGGRNHFFLKANKRSDFCL